MAKQRRVIPPETRFAELAARWAQKQGLPFGNLWEPSLILYMTSEFRRLGADANALAFVEAMTAHRLGLAIV